MSEDGRDDSPAELKPLHALIVRQSNPMSTTQGEYKMESTLKLMNLVFFALLAYFAFQLIEKFL
jgi:hypothetical protein